MNDKKVSLSVLMPVYNEQHLILEALRQLQILESCELLSSIEAIIVDDGSRDRTPEILAEFASEQLRRELSANVRRIQWRFHRHARNGGKGAAIRTALSLATGEISVIQDADLEYDPRDLPAMLRVMIEQEADAVYGSRFASAGTRRILMFHHELGNRLLTFICNLISNLNLSDVWTGYKVIRTALFKSIPIRSNDFRLEPEITIKLAKREARIFEVPISYFGRTYQEGKKIGWRDGLLAITAMVRYAISDDIYCADEYNSRNLARHSRTRQYNNWVADIIRPYCGERVLEIGSGTGSLTRMMIPRNRYIATDINPLYLQTLTSLATSRPYMQASYCDVTDVSSFPHTGEEYDTVICLNVIERLTDDRAALSNIKSVLSHSGRAIIRVPQGPRHTGTLDESFGYRRRYTRQSLRALARIADSV
jgi:glycosyltransferase involved in cell wall biosynthesis